MARKARKTQLKGASD